MVDKASYRILATVVATLAVCLFSISVYADLGGAADSIPFKKDEINILGTLASAVISLLFLSGLVIGGLWLARKYIPGVVFSGTMSGKRIKVLEVRRISPKASLFLVEVDGQTHLLGQGDGLQILNTTGPNSAEVLIGSKE